MATKKTEKNIDELIDEALVTSSEQPYMIPENWIWLRIGSICDAINGRVFKSKDWKEKGIPIIRIQNLKDPNAKFNYYQGAFDEKHFIKKNNLLFAWSGTPGTSFGAYIWEKEDSLLNHLVLQPLALQPLRLCRAVQ